MAALAEKRRDWFDGENWTHFCESGSVLRGATPVPRNSGAISVPADSRKSAPNETYRALIVIRAGVRGFQAKYQTLAARSCSSTAPAGKNT
jgi:hypothetical protein